MASILFGDGKLFTVSSFIYPQTYIRPYDLRYIRVDLPPWFSSLSVNVDSDVDLDVSSFKKNIKSTLPLICFRDGSPPLPDVLNFNQKGIVLGNFSVESFEALEGLQNVQCFPMQRNITLKLTNEQISPGTWYLGLFNGIGATKAQGKMIVRVPAYSFHANITVDGCSSPTILGQNCNQTVEPLSCAASDIQNVTEKSLNVLFPNQSIENLVSCSNSFDSSCHGGGEPKTYFLDVVELTEKFIISAANVKFNSNISGNVSGIVLMCYVRHGALSSVTLHDYSSDLNKAPLAILSPKVGRWYITILPVNTTKEVGGISNNSVQVCYSMNGNLLTCPAGKAGPNCAYDSYALQTIIKRQTTLFESYYLPLGGNYSSDGDNFPLQSLVSNSSYDKLSNDTWTYFQLNIPRGAAGGNIHIRITSDSKINYETYVRFGGLPSLQNWDYFYANTTNSSDGSMFFKSYNCTDQKIDFYLLYVREGTWNFGLRRLNDVNYNLTDDASMSVSIDRCPKRCSNRGDCRNALDASGLTTYNFCSCDRDHGGFDCSIEIVSPRVLSKGIFADSLEVGVGHVKQSIALIVSNAAAILPAFWALRQKAFAEWVLFTASGVSSGIYHACDVGTWCPLPYGVLQFMDFWLSFMAVVSVFIYLASTDEGFKRTIQTVVTILTALMALTKATRSSNIIIVIIIGSIGLLIGWLIELSTKFRFTSFSLGFSLNMMASWHNVRQWLRNFIKSFLKRFRWIFMLAGFVALCVAAASWQLETSESYWIWHSVWHITIYTAAFFFLCSKEVPGNGESERPPNSNYELTRQNSSSRGVNGESERPPPNSNYQLTRQNSSSRGTESRLEALIESRVYPIMPKIGHGFFTQAEM
ncbi:hypothetical protein ACFE04_016303 [Oxalis oulophora]